MGRGAQAIGSSRVSNCETTRQSLHIRMRSTAAVAEHPVLLGKLRHHALDRSLRAERLAAADAMEGLFLLDHHGASAARRNYSAARAGSPSPGRCRGKCRTARRPPLGRRAAACRGCRERAGRAGADAGQAQRAAGGIHGHRPERRAGRQREDVDRLRRMRVKMIEGNRITRACRPSPHGGTRADRSLGQDQSALQTSGSVLSTISMRPPP